MEEILDTWPHKSLNEKWKWKVWVLPWFFSFLSFTHIISGKRGREKISSAKVRTSLVPAKKTWVTEAAELTSAGCARGAEQKALDSIYMSALHHVCCEHIVMFCMILCDLWRYMTLVIENTKDFYFPWDWIHKNSHGSWKTHVWN